MPDVEYLNYGVVEGRGWNLYAKDIFENAAGADLDEEDHGVLDVSGEESILDAAERAELGWSSKCFKGRCGRCSAVVVDGEVGMDASQEFLTEAEVAERDMCLPCVSKPKTDVKLVYGVRELDALDERVK